ncbi:MAG: hypothetical protein GWN29_08575, partial [Gammaproteobacteria bacterium]|nr:hypothetical protein [Gammaproteobacteria bacterium]
MAGTIDYHRGRSRRHSGEAMKNRAPKLSEEQYACNFADIQRPLTAEQAMVESARCLFCFEAPCITACP